MRLAAASLVAGAAVLLFAVHVRPWGYVPLILGVVLGLIVDRALGRDLALIGIGQVILSTISLNADLTDAGIARFTVVLSLAVVVPWAISRWVFKHRVIVFPMGTRDRWSRTMWIYLGVVIVLGFLILPPYFIGSGAYQNWPDTTTANEIGRLFVGVNAVGIWDELFFVCVVFALLRQHFPMWHANILQSVVFVSFLWELGYR